MKTFPCLNSKKSPKEIDGIMESYFLGRFEIHTYKEDSEIEYAVGFVNGNIGITY